MLNLLKFREHASYPESFDAKSCRGIEAYNQRYLHQAKDQITKIGGTILYQGDVCATIIGPEVDYWNSMLLVKYPSIELFFTMVSTSDYQILRIHRSASLEDSHLIAIIESDKEGLS